MAPGQDDPVPMSAVGMPEERSGVVATAERAAAVAAAAALSLLVAWSRAKEPLAMVMHGGFKMSEGEAGGLGEGRAGGRSRLPLSARPSPLPPRPRPRPLHSKRSAAGKTTRDRCLTRRALRLQLPVQRRGTSPRQPRCAGEGAAGPPPSGPRRSANLGACGPREDRREEAGLPGHAVPTEESTKARGGGRRRGVAEESAARDLGWAGAPQPWPHWPEGARGGGEGGAQCVPGRAGVESWHCHGTVCLFI